MNLFHQGLALLLLAALNVTSGEPTPRQFPEFILGATTHFGHGKGVADSTLRLFAEAGMISPRDDSGWGLWEAEKGKFRTPECLAAYLQEAEKRGLHPLHILGFGNHIYEAHDYPRTPEQIENTLRYMEFVVRQYRGQGHLYQVWNEWLQGTGMSADVIGKGDLPTYLNFLRKAYPRLKAADPDCLVLSNAFAIGDLTDGKAFEQGLLQNCDMVAINCYGFANRGKERLPEAVFAQVKSVYELAARHQGGQPKPFAVTESGQPNNVAWNGSSDAETGDYLARFSLLLKTLPAIRGFWFYDFQDDGYSAQYHEDNFGLVQPDLTPKEPYFVMKSLASLLRNGRFVRELSSPDPEAKLLLFRWPDNSDTLVAWTPKRNCRKRIVLRRGAAPDSPLKLTVAGFPATERRWGYREWVTPDGNRQQRPAEQPELFSLTVTGRPVLLTGKLNGIIVDSVTEIDRPERLSPNAPLLVPADIAVFPAAGESSAVSFGQPANYRMLTNEKRTGKSDLDAQFSIRRDRDWLQVEVTVTDDRHEQSWHGPDLWKGDSIQLGFAVPQKLAQYPDGTEYQAALTPDGPEVRRDTAQFPNDQPTRASLTATREKEVTFYRFRIPLDELGVGKQTGRLILGFSLVVNENDDNGRKGYLHWGDGIGNWKNAVEYNWVVIGEPAL